MNSPDTYLNGSMVAAADACLRIDDTGFEQGDGLFETLRVENGLALELDAHLRRLERGMQLLSLTTPESPTELRAAVRLVAAAAPRPVARLRITLSHGVGNAPPTRVVRAAVYRGPSPEELARGVPVVRLRGARIDSASVLAGVKSTSYGQFAQAARMALERGAYEGLLANERGELAEATRSNVMVWRAGGFVTPPLAAGCLPGIVRGLLIDDGIVAETPIDFDALAEATALVLTNSLVGVLPVSSLDGRPLRVEPAEQLQRRLAEIREAGS